MEALKQELARKRKQNDSNLKDNATKYLKKSQLESVTPEPVQTHPQEDTINKEEPEAEEEANITDNDTKDFSISNDECIRRLRLKSEPIRLFAESDRERRLRLRALELLASSSNSKGQENDLRKALEGVGQAELEQQSKNASTAVSAKIYDQSEVEITWKMVKVDNDKLYATIYKWMKNMLRLWENTLSQRPDDVRRSKQGQLAAANQVQTANYLKPLFKALKSKTIEMDVLTLLGEIILYAQERKYQNANDAYLRLSIGNSPWPIGVTMVGIHDRSAREKISSGSVAHVLNDEVSRKYIQSVKRVLTFAQTQFPPEDVSQMVG